MNSNYEIPEGAEFYTEETYSKKRTYYKKEGIGVNRMVKILLYFDEQNKEWKVKFGYLPWNDLIPIPVCTYDCLIYSID
jgi:hypothetical protein